MTLNDWKIWVPSFILVLALPWSQWLSKSIYPEPSAKNIHPQSLTHHFLKPTHSNSLRGLNSLAHIGPSLPNLSMGCLNLLNSFTSLDLTREVQEIDVKDQETIAIRVVSAKTLLEKILNLQHNQGCLEFPEARIYEQLQEYGASLWDSCYQAWEVDDNRAGSEAQLQQCFADFFMFRSQAADALGAYLSPSERDSLPQLAKQLFASKKDSLLTESDRIAGLARKIIKRSPSNQSRLMNSLRTGAKLRISISGVEKDLVMDSSTNHSQTQ